MKRTSFEGRPVHPLFPEEAPPLPTEQGFAVRLDFSPTELGAWTPERRAMALAGGIESPDRLIFNLGAFRPPPDRPAESFFDGEFLCGPQFSVAPRTEDDRQIFRRFFNELARLDGLAGEGFAYMKRLGWRPTATRNRQLEPANDQLEKAERCMEHLYNQKQTAIYWLLTAPVFERLREFPILLFDPAGRTSDHALFRGMVRRLEGFAGGWRSRIMLQCDWPYTVDLNDVLRGSDTAGVEVEVR